MEALAKFGKWCLDEMRYECTDLDGGSLQDKAIELGLLVYEEVTEPCGDMCLCADYGPFPQKCLRTTEAAKLEDAK